jgi:uncharacterized protein with PIN domain
MMPTPGKTMNVLASFRFYAELNDFLPRDRKHVTFEHAVVQRTAVKDAVESLSVPHTEIDLILANGESVDFWYQVRDHDRISAYPVFEAIDITPLTRLRPEPFRHVRFVLDAHLGRLAASLRLAGFDTLYRRDFGDGELALVAAREHRILVTRDQALLKRRSVSHGCWLRETNPRLQFVDILRRFDLTRLVQPFSRCLNCNEQLTDVSSEAVRDRLPPRVREQRDEFRVCRGCDRVYWKGSHYDAMVRFLDAAVIDARRPPSERVRPGEGNQ